MKNHMKLWLTPHRVTLRCNLLRKSLPLLFLMPGWCSMENTLISPIYYSLQLHSSFGSLQTATNSEDLPTGKPASPWILNRYRTKRLLILQKSPPCPELYRLDSPQDSPNHLRNCDYQPAHHSASPHWDAHRSIMRALIL